MSALRGLLRRLSDTPVGDRLRLAADFHPPVTLRPLDPDAAVSDLFPWRLDGEWDTRFDLSNVPSLVFPGQAPVDRSTVVFFDSEGREIARREFELAPFEVRPLVLGDVLKGRGGSGTLAAFHRGGPIRILKRNRAHYAERGYLGFQRRGDVLWSMLHGNLHVLAKSPGQDGLSFVHAPRRAGQVYRPQLRFDDCRRFDLVFTNPSKDLQHQLVILLDADRREVARLEADIPSRGVRVFSWDNTDRAVALVESRGAMAMWRPAIFKIYDSHFDVLHG